MKPVVVTITKTKRKSQPYTVKITPPGKAEPYTLNERYARRFTAKRGALRHLDAHTCPQNEATHEPIPGREWNYSGGYAWQTGKGRRIIFK